jgi:hypothetical protein
MNAALVGSMRAWEATRVAVGADPLLGNRFGELDLCTGELAWRTLDPNPDCDRCGGGCDA